jgi:hypothetical protein
MHQLMVVYHQRHNQIVCKLEQEQKLEEDEIQEDEFYKKEGEYETITVDPVVEEDIEL